MKSPGQRIAYYRKMVGLSQKELAYAIGVPSPVLSRYENGVRDVPVAVLIKAAKILKLTCDTLVGINDVGVVAQNPAECTIIRTSRKLNNTGVGKLLEYASELSEHPKYVLR